MIALKDGEQPQMIEVKANKDGGPFKNFCRPDRAELKAAAEKSGAVAMLCYWPPNRQPRWIPASDWPSTVDN